MATMGGYQTLLMRMSSHLIDAGHSVFLVSQGIDDRLASQFSPELNIQTSGIPFVDLYERAKFKRFYERLQLPEIDLIFCIDLMSYAVAGFLKLTEGCERARLILGLFQPDSVGQLRKKSATSLLVRSILARSGRQTSVVAMTKRLKREWHDFVSSERNMHFIPLPVDLVPFKSIDHKPKKFRIVSVGRLDDYKTYNIYMIRILKSLVEQGYDLSYDIYGEGPYREKVEAEIIDCGLESRVHLKGMLPYSEFPTALQSAYAFVGMGTAAIEAAAVGVPTVYSAPRDMTAVTHGLLHQFDLTEKGGFAAETCPPLKVENVMLGLLQMTEQQYEEQSNASREAMETYSIDRVMQQYMQVIDGIEVGQMGNE